MFQQKGFFTLITRRDWKRLCKGASVMKELDYVTIGKRIRLRRKELGYTQDYVARQLDINPSHISNIECGRANPSLTALVNIANILCCSVDFFLHEEYTYHPSVSTSLSLDNEIKKRLQYCDKEKKNRIIKMIDLM